MDNSEREDLDQLVRSDGWRRFLAHVEQEWGTKERGGGVRFANATYNAASESSEADALSKLRQICVAQREIHALIAWVEGRLKDATKADQELVAVGPIDYSRRGRL